MTVGVLVISPEIVKIIGSKEYWDGARIIMWVVFAATSTVIIYFAMLVFHGFIVNKVMKIKVVDNIFVALVVAAIFVITCVMHMFLEMLLIRIALGIVIDAVIVVIIVMMYKRIGKVEL